MLNRQHTTDALDAFRRYVVQQSRANLTRQGKNVSKELWNSIGGDVSVHPNSFELSFRMEKYGQFQDRGVKGAVSSRKAPNSPFKFGSGSGTKGGLSKGIRGWVRARAFQFRDRKSGKFMSYEQTSILIIRSIFRNGMKPSNFFSRPFDLAYEKLPDDVVEAYGLDIESFLKTALKI